MAVSATQLELHYSFDDWCYWSDINNRFLPLPGWATFFMCMGKSLAELSPTSRPTLVAVSTPTARYAAALSVAGYLLGSDEIVPLEEHIEFLRCLEPGRQVWLHKEKKRIKGTFSGFVPLSNGEGVKILIGSGRGAWVSTIPLTAARQIQVASSSKPSKRSRFLDKVPKSLFALEALRSAENPRRWEQSRLEAAIVGQSNRLRDEITQQRFAIERNGHYTGGTLQDIIRTIDFGEAQDPHGYASAIETPGAAVDLGDTPGLVVFDGPRAFMRANTRHQGARHWVVILDRTSRSFADGASVVDDLYLQRAGDFKHPTLPTPPAGIEMTCFERGS
jgi:hypothetical protein